MKLEDLNVMSDVALQMKVARLRGATEFEWRPNDSSIMKELWQFVPQGSDGNLLTGGWSRCPNYLYDIAAAWSLVDVMVATSDTTVIDLVISRGRNFCAAYLDHGRFKGDETNIKRSIAKAFILAMDPS